MGIHDSVTKPDPGLDYDTLAEAVDQMREAMRAAVAGLVADGFTKREAHALVAGVFAGNIKGYEEEA